jgi:hypothetical protein
MMAMTIFMQASSSIQVRTQSNSGFGDKLLRYSKRFDPGIDKTQHANPAPGARLELKKTARDRLGPRAAGYRTDGGVGWLAGARCS